MGKKKKRREEGKGEKNKDGFFGNGEALPVRTSPSTVSFKRGPDKADDLDIFGRTTRPSWLNRILRKDG